MTFITWIKLNVLFECAFVVFTLFTSWKLVKIKKQISDLEELQKLIIRNPSAARKSLRKLKK